MGWMGSEDKAGADADLGGREEGGAARTQRGHGQAELGLAVALGEELLEHVIRPAARDAEAAARVGKVRGVQQIGAQRVAEGRVAPAAPLRVGPRRMGADVALELLEVLEVPLHVRGEDGEHHDPADLPGHAGLERGEDVDAAVGGHASEDGHAVEVLLDALVVEGEGAAGGGVLVEEVVEAVVAGVVDHGRDQEGEGSGRAQKLRCSTLAE
jgi:hypothetical protein